MSLLDVVFQVASKAHVYTKIPSSMIQQFLTIKPSF